MSRLSGATVTVHSLVGAAQVELALKCLGSLVAAVPFPIRLVLHDDGSLGPAGRARFNGEFGDACEFVDRQRAGEQVAERLRAHPRCARFRAEHLFGPKLFDVPLLSTGRVIYADTDVLWTRPLDCPAYFAGRGAAFVVMQDLQEAYAVRLAHWPRMRKRGIRLASRFCAGLMSLEPSALDLDYVEWLLGVDAADDLFGGFRFWAEQTIYAALAARAGCAWIDPRECVVAHHRNFARAQHAAIIHFAGFSRDLFADRYRALEFPPLGRAAPQILGTQPTPACGLGRRVLSACRKRMLLRDPARATLPRAPLPASFGAIEPKP